MGRFEDALAEVRAVQEWQEREAATASLRIRYQWPGFSSLPTITVEGITGECVDRACPYVATHWHRNGRTWGFRVVELALIEWWEA